VSDATPHSHGPRARPLTLELPGFEGPLDLLLHLIRKHELDIFDIPIAFITEEYLGYIDAMTELELGVAGEYLVMAATLLHIKSQMLLPRPEASKDDDGTEEGEDPRAALVRRLLEYQRYRDAAERLGERTMLGRDIFVRPSRADVYRDEAGPADLLGVDLFALLDAYRRLVATRPAAAVHEITPERLSLRETIGRVADYLQATPRTTLLDLLYVLGPEPTRSEVVIVFLAVLEMAKLRLVRLFQARLTSADLIVERAVIDYEEVAGRLDGIELDE
jgi:segregation and condensation protein A